MNNIIDIYNNILKYDNNIINFVIDKNNIIWFKFLSISNLLNYKSSKDALKVHVFKENKIRFKELNLYFKSKDRPDTIYINESGLYTFLIKSKMPKAIEFQLWIINEVLPNLRKYGKYEINKKIKNKLKKLNNKIKELEKANKILKNNMTKNKYPIGDHIYVITDDSKYKIGYTKSLKKRLEVYNTGKANLSTYAYYKKTKCAYEIELCVKALLNKYIYKSNKEFYNCSLDKIIEAITKCIKIEKKCSKCNEINNNIQIGGSNNYIINELLNKYNYKYNYYKSIIIN
jgi:prophage antirepressor-like protein